MQLILEGGGRWEEEEDGGTGHKTSPVVSIGGN